VDDIIFGGSSHSLVSRFQEMMESEFQMSMMGELTFFLGIQVKQTKQGTFVHQTKYTKDLMKKLNMAELKPVSTLMSSATSPGLGFGIQFAVGFCARFQASPRSSHRTTVQQVFRYLKHTPTFGIWHSSSFSLDLVGFFDTDFAGCGIDRKSISGTCHFLGSSLVCWSSRKQSSVAQSTTEAEYVAARELVFAIHMAWFEGELVLWHIYIVYFAFLLHFLHTYLSHLASHVILACICLIMLIIVLG
jgi:hypothetical protein